jgi:hypothetical protein
MADYEEAIARKVLQLLQSAQPHPKDQSLIEAEKRASADRNTSIRDRDNLRADTWLAIKTAQKAADLGQEDAEARLEAAQTAARNWLRARSGPG